MLVFLIASLEACATKETLRRNFRAEREACIGQRFGDPRWWWCGWEEPVHVVLMDRDRDEYQVISDQMPGCRWSYVVDRRSGIVRAWRYLGDPAPCYLPVDWLGAW
jgi:hypothetical protein